MKKIASVLLICLLAVSIAGCGSDITLNGQENDVVAEYIAGQILKVNGAELWNQKQLYNDLGNKEQQTESSSPSGNQGTVSEETKVPGISDETKGESGSGTAGSFVSSGDTLKDIATVIGVQECNITNGKVVCADAYTSPDGLFKVSALSDCEVYSVEFTISNQSGKDVIVNSIDKPLSFKLEVGGKTVTKVATLLGNDLTNIKNVTVKNGESYKAVVLFQVSKPLAGSENSMHMYAYINGVNAGEISGL